ncbi:MAG: response regulator [Bdellovibrionaceae bacterium]|nr:response regulator [Pseudobdellovibrionaceae bacterium]
MIEILLLDDEPDLQEITFVHLTKKYKNINITNASSGNEGISLLTGGQKFDFNISDFNMPNGNGIDLLKFKTAFGYPGYFILYTSQLYVDVPENSDPSFLGVVEKFNSDKLFDCISEAIEKSQILKIKYESQ